MDTVLVTGGAGFIGSNFVRYFLRATPARVVVVDKLTYAGHRQSLADVEKDPRFSFVQADIADGAAMAQLFEAHAPTAIVNFAAETHVDRSIDGPRAFLQTNVVGVFELLEASRHYVAKLGEAARSAFRFLQVSTDEVYGSLGKDGLFREDTAYAPNSPYAATKAGADHLVRSYFKTYALPTVITNCSNNYGPYQFPEKLIPLMVLNALEGKALPIYGDGGNIRDWLYVEDHCEAIALLLQKGRLGEKYNVGGNNERTNLQVLDTLCSELERIIPAAKNETLKAKGLTSYAALKTFVADRPGHDRRYAIDGSKLTSELGWKPRHDFASGMAATIEWYVSNRAWCEAVQSQRYGRERLGLGAK